LNAAADRRAWDAFENACSYFFGNKIIRNLRRNRGGATFHKPCLGVQHVVEIPFPAIPLGFFFPGNMGAVSDEYDESFLQVIYRMMGKKIERQMKPKYVG